MAFKAKYDGRCGECSEEIRAGDLLEWDEGVVVHEACLTASSEPAQRPTCPDCWQVLSVAGACGCGDA